MLDSSSASQPKRAKPHLGAGRVLDGVLPTLDELGWDDLYSV